MDKAKQITELKDLALELIHESVDMILCSHRDTLTASYYFHSGGEREVNFHSPVLKIIKIIGIDHQGGLTSTMWMKPIPVSQTASVILPDVIMFVRNCRSC